MVSFFLRLKFLFLVGMMSILTPSLTAAAPVEVKLLQQWRGDIPNSELIQRSTNWFITSQDQFEKLWKAWRPKEELPAVDFTKEFVSVSTSPNSGYSIHPTLEENGNLRIMAKARVYRINSKTNGFDITVKGPRPGWRYLITTMNREGVKIVSGKELPKAAPPAIPK